MNDGSTDEWIRSAWVWQLRHDVLRVRDQRFYGWSKRNERLNALRKFGPIERR